MRNVDDLTIAGQKTGEDRVADSGGGVDLVQPWMKTELLGLASRDLGGVLIGDPARVDAVHVDAVSSVVLRRGAGEHVECGLGHVGVRVLVGLVGPVKHTLHGRDVDDVLVAGGDP